MSIYYRRSGFLGADEEHLVVDVEGEVAVELEQIFKGLHEATFVVLLKLLANLYVNADLPTSASLCLFDVVYADYTVFTILRAYLS